MFEVKNNIFEMEIMMSVRIIIDSASDLTKEQADKLGLDFLPLKTIFGTKEYLDGITLSHQQFYEKLIESDCMPTTSQIPPHDFEQLYADVKEKKDTAVVITLSSRLSGTFQSANIALDGYEDCITIVDSENVCLGEQILVMYACRLRDAGASASEIAKALDQKKKDVRVLALLDTLEYLKRGGRISKTAALTGLEDSLLQKYIEDNTDLWKSYVEELPISSIGSTIGTHTGPGGICVAFFSKTNS